MNAPTDLPNAEIAAMIEEINLNVEKEEYILLPASIIDHNPFNNRRYYDPAKLEALANDMKVNGQSQPCVVRAVEGGRYQLAVGHRRHRGAIIAYGPNAVLKCLIRTMSDAQMHAIAQGENQYREDVSIIDECEGAARMLQLVDGDRESAAAHLGWKPELLERRLALLSLSENCRQALAEKKIVLGVAELLAAIPQNVQDKALPTIIAGKFTVEQVRGELLSKALPLEKAIFDKTECGECERNSDRQATLFDTTVGAGCCTDPSCYRKKSMATVTVRAEELKTRYPRVIVIASKTDSRGVALTEADLGAEQLAACKGCADFGAAISGLPGEYGALSEGVCLNTEKCHGEKKAEYAKAMKAKAKAAAKAELEANPATVSSATANPVASSASAAPAPGEAKPATTNGVRNALREYRVKLWRRSIEATAARKPDLARMALLAMAADHQASCLDNATVHDQCAGAGTLSDRLRVYAAVQPENVEAALTDAIATMAAKANEVSLPALLRHFQCDLSEVWVADAEFGKLLTKSELEAYATEVGLVQAIGDDWKKISGGKKDEFAAALLGVSSFDYSRVPSLLLPSN